MNPGREKQKNFIVNSPKALWMVYRSTSFRKFPPLCQYQGARGGTVEDHSIFLDPSLSHTKKWGLGASGKCRSRSLGGVLNTRCGGYGAAVNEWFSKQLGDHSVPTLAPAPALAWWCLTNTRHAKRICGYLRISWLQMTSQKRGNQNHTTVAIICKSQQDWRPVTKSSEFLQDKEQFLPSWYTEVSHLSPVWEQFWLLTTTTTKARNTTNTQHNTEPTKTDQPNIILGSR